MDRRFLLNHRDAKFMGVAAGISDYTRADVSLVRLAFVALTLLTGPVMILLYLAAGFLTPNA